MSDQIKNLPDFEQVEREVSRKIKISWYNQAIKNYKKK